MVYDEGMDALGFPLANQVALIIAPHAAQPQMLELAAHLALNGPLRVFDCGNRFNVYPVARAIRSRSENLKAALGRIRLARAFTCYQVQALLEEAPEDPMPALVIDLLATFYDEDVKLPEARRLLRTCLGQLRRLSRSGPVVVSARPPKAPVYAERIGLLESLRSTATAVWEAGEELPPPAAQAISLFPEAGGTYDAAHRPYDGPDLEDKVG